jgi:hypothetical protein
MATIIKDSTNGQRCSECNYDADGYEHLECSGCKMVWHKQCVKEEHQLCLGIREGHWRCTDCVRCVNCLGSAGKVPSQQLMVCRWCNSNYHYECLDPNTKLSLPSNFPCEDDFTCERCVQCESCGSREAGKNRFNKWSKDFKLCAPCNKKRKNKQFCLVCDGFWPEDVLSDETALTAYLTDSVITCGNCTQSVHLKCDRIFEDPSILGRFKLGSSDPLKYHCPECRQQKRAAIISK